MPTTAGIQGLRGTGQFDTDHRPTNYRQGYAFMEPNGTAPLNALLSMASAESTDDAKYNNFRDHLPDRTATVATITTPATSTSFTLSDSDENKFIHEHAMLMNTATGEMILVASYTDATNTVECTRNIGGTSLEVNAADVLVVAGTAYPAGSDVGESITWDATVSFNYAQTFRNNYMLTEELNSTYLRTGPAAVDKQAKTLKLHMSDIERAMFWGRKAVLNENTSTPTWFTGGITNEITNIVDCAGAAGDTAGDNIMTEAEFDSFIMNDLFAWGSNTRLVFCGPKVAEHLHVFGKNRWSPDVVEGTYGVSFMRYKFASYELMIHTHPQFRQVPGATYSAVFLDFPELCYRYLEGRDTQLLEGRQGNGVDAVIDEYLTQCGLELKTDLPHAYIKNWQAVA